MPVAEKDNEGSMADRRSHRTYRVVLKDARISSVELNLHGVLYRTFRDPDTRNRLPKLYVVRSGPDPVYVGQTTQAMSTRLRQGLRARGEHGYYGYMWRHLPEVKILVWCFSNRTGRHLETIEGELVHLLRSRTGKWPRHQTEIHFHNATKSQKITAEAIFEECVGIGGAGCQNSIRAEDPESETPSRLSS